MIKNYKLQDIKEEICKKENKELYGEVFTPFSFTSKILDVIPEDTFKNPNLKWLDPGAGTGNFSIILYFKLLIMNQRFFAKRISFFLFVLCLTVKIYMMFCSQVIHQFCYHL